MDDGRGPMLGDGMAMAVLGDRRCQESTDGREEEGSIGDESGRPRSDTLMLGEPESVLADDVSVGPSQPPTARLCARRVASSELPPLPPLPPPLPPRCRGECTGGVLKNGRRRGRSALSGVPTINWCIDGAAAPAMMAWRERFRTPSAVSCGKAIQLDTTGLAGPGDGRRHKRGERGERNYKVS